MLYMHDGQNVFDAATSFAGEWEVDETLNELFEAGDPGCIVVAIDNGGTHRIDEYSPWENENYGGGEGDLYLQFITETLKPYIDAEYRTLPEREWTGIMGSSMGGLISTYGGIEYSDVFSRIGTFSPSYWFSEESFEHVETTPHDEAMRIYTIVGSGEGTGMTEGVQTMELTYEGAGYESDEHQAIEHEDGQHSEWYWAREFAAAYLWLWPGSPASVADTGTGGYGLRIWPNPVVDTVHIECARPDRVTKTEVTDLTGKVLFTANQYVHEVSVGQWKSNVLLLRIHLSTGQVVTRRVLLSC